MSNKAEIGLIGLGVMGQNLTLNMAEKGFGVAVYNRTPTRTEAFVRTEEASRFGLKGAAELAGFVDLLRQPRAIVLMIQAGAATDAQIDALVPLLEPGDVVVDGGNANFPDTIRREQALKQKGIQFVGAGISGGEEGARHGPSIMPGGTEEAWQRLRPVLEKIAAQVDGQPCCAHIGPDGAGHFVKMLHNGIEYADMQLIAEAYAVLKDGLGFDYPAMQAVFQRWNQGELDSYLIEITADILTKHDPETGQPMPEVIVDAAGQKGTGRWSVSTAMDLGVPAPTIAEAVAARSLSAYKAERVRAAQQLKGPAARFEGAAEDLVGKLEDALFAAKICAYAQGFAVMAAAGREYGWDLDFGRIASIWRGGCIIRARFLGRIKEAYTRDPALPNLLLDPFFAEHLQRTQEGWREVVAMAARTGIPIPGFASALAYFDGYRSARLSANLIQAQRDYFGAHTFERVDRAGTFHTDWSAI